MFKTFLATNLTTYDSKSFKVINTFSPLTRGHAKSSAVVPVLKIDDMDKMCLSQALNRLRKIPNYY